MAAYQAEVQSTVPATTALVFQNCQTDTSTNSPLLPSHPYALSRVRGPPKPWDLLTRDWAGDRQSRKSVSGCMILHGKHLIKAWTKQLSIVAPSTAEAELYAGNRAATESMGVQAFAKDLGRVVPVRLHIDSSAALSNDKAERACARQSTLKSSTCGSRRRSATTS